MSPTSFILVAIDGGAASGKSSTARALSERFHLLHADTGSYYRALSARLLHSGVAPAAPANVRAELTDLHLGTQLAGRSAQLTIGGDPVPEADLRSDAVNAAVSHFAALPEVRAALLPYQRGLADLARLRGFRGLVMEGRDIGSVIFPHADLRIYLHADPAERARRRAREGQLDAVVERDRLDSSRENSPMMCPAGAVAIDTSHLALPAVVERISALITTRLLGG